MIVRILGEGQLEVPDAELDTLNALDADVQAAVEAGDETAFRTALQALVAGVRASGTPVADDALVESDFVLPAPDASLEEVRELLGDEGLVPG